MKLIRKQELNNTVADNSIIIQVGGDFAVDEALYKELIKNHQNLKLFNRLIKEKLDLCKKDILNKDAKNLKRTLDTIFNYGLSGIEDDLKQLLYFYRFILGVFEKNIEYLKDCLDNLKGDYYNEAVLLKGFQEASHQIKYCDYNGLCIETQLVILDILFESGFYTNIETLYLEDSNKNSMDILTYYYGLSAFNLQQFENAYNAFEKVLHLDIDVRIRFLQVLSLAQIELLKFNKDRVNFEELKRIFYEIQNLIKADISNLTGCELTVALTQAQIGIWISPDTFIEVFQSYGTKIQENPNMQFFLGLYYEECHEYEKAIEIYYNGDWKNDENILYRLLFVNLLSGKNNKIIQIFEKVSDGCRTASNIGLWLSALKNINSKEYNLAVRLEVEKYKDNIEDLFYIMMSVDNDKKLFNELFLNIIIEKIEEIKKSDFQKKLGYADILLRYEYAELCFELLTSLKDGFRLDDEIVYNFYKSLNRYKYAEIRVSEKEIPTGKTALYLENKIKICDWFIQNDNGTDLFLKEKINCLDLQKKRISMLACTKQLYDITHEESVAANIIALLLENETSSKNDYEYYIHALKNTEDPRCLIAVAAASSRIGKTEMADFYSYKAIFVLNGKDDFDIYNSFLGLHNEMIYDHRHSEVEFKEVMGNTVVNLNVTCLYSGEDNVDLTETICLDSEVELEKAVQDNISMGASHYCSKDPIYLRLLNKKPGQKFLLNGMEYVISEIVGRGVYAYRHVLSKLISNLDKSNIKAVSVGNKSIDTMWEEMKKVIHDCQKGRSESDETEGKGDIYLNLYHFKKNMLGLPIDVLTQKNYDNYFNVVRLLLFGKDQALYAGQADPDKISGHKIVVTLSTLVILCLMKRLDLLDNVAEQVIIPTSLVKFLHIRVKKSIEMQAVSLGKLVEIADGSPMLLPFDDVLVDMWNIIYEFCLQFEQMEITDEERMEFDISGSISAEAVFLSLYIDRMQIDCMALAKKMDAVYLCDDLFFRNIADIAGIKNANLTNLVYILDSKKRAAEICMDFSKTNYIYVPFICENMEGIKHMWRNLLEGDIKGKFYGPIIRNLVNDEPKKIWNIEE